MNHPALQRRARARAFTLLELVLSTAVTSIILMAMGSTILLASKALPGANHPLEERIAAAAVVDRMASELESALFVTERTATAITIVVADRDANGTNETIRYAWSGTSGAALTRSYNGATAATALTDVRTFALAYTYNTVTESYPSAAGSIVTSSRYQVAEVRITLRGGPEITSRAETVVKTYNLPDCVTAAWDADFSSKPTTLGTLANSAGDWVRRDGAAFSAASLVGGVWKADSTIDTRPLCDFSTLTTVDLRLRDTTYGGTGAIVWINTEWSGSTAAPIFLVVQRQSNGTQALGLYKKTSSSNTTTLVIVYNLPTTFINVRLLFDPARDLVNIRVNDMQRGSYGYTRFSQSSTDKFLSLSYSGSTVEYDNVCVRVWSASP